MNRKFLAFLFVLAGMVPLLFYSCSEKASPPVDGEEEGDGEPFPDEMEGVEEADMEREELDWEEFAVTGVNPSHGPFIGGTTVLVRGRGFEEAAIVYFGSHMVQLADTEFVDDNRIEVVTPAGSPGSVDVKVVIDDKEAVKEDGFTYDVFYLNPATGSKAGGTYVEITGYATNFEPGSTITFEGEEAGDVDWISATSMTCKTPPGAIGTADVEIDGDEDDYEVKDAYVYYDSADPTMGGLGGGPINGSVNVTIINAMTGERVEEAFCMLGLEGDTEYRGLTDANGQITFSGPDLRGRQTITASKEGFESTTIERFDATDVTIFLLPQPT